MTLVELLRRLLIDEECEGGQPHKESYKDSKGLWTIGIGHLLDRNQTDEELAAMGLDDELDEWEGFKISEQQCYNLFGIDVREAMEDLYGTFTKDELEELGPTRGAIIIAMVFQMGAAGFRAFKNFIAAVKAGDFDKAAEEMLDSKWARKDSPERAKRASDAMRDNYFERYTKVAANPKPVSPVVDDKSIQSVPTDQMLIMTNLYVSELQRRLDNNTLI